MSRPTGRKTASQDEVAWVQKTAEETGWPHAIVGYADMTVDDMRSATRSPETLSISSRYPYADSLA